MFCPECGTKNPDEMKFCSQCGSPLVENTTGDTTSKSVQMNVEKKVQNISKEVGKKAEVAIKNNKKKILIWSVVAFVVIIILGSVASSVTTPEYVAEKYFKGLTHHDWNTVYSVVSMNKSEFISKDGFVAAMEESVKRNDNLNVLNYEVKKNKKIKNDVSETVIIEFVTYNSSVAQTMQIHLAKQKSKKFLFFDNYKVNADDLIACDYKIRTSPFVKVSVDGIELNEKYISSTEQGRIEYTIPQIFCSTHKIKIYGDLVEEREEEIQIGTTGTYEVSNVLLSESEYDRLNKEAESVFREIISSAISGKEFSELSAQFTSDKDSLQSIKNYYDSICKNTVVKNGYGLKAVDFKGFEIENNDRKIGSDGSVQIRLRYEYDTQSIYKNYNDELEERASTYTRTGDLRIQFVYENNKYVVKSISGNLYY